MSEWQPIETAPKDGDAVIVHCQAEEAVGIAQWKYLCMHGLYKWGWYWVHAEPDEDPDPYDYYPECFPSHWMPLPAPPEAK
jgi:hypothetical protein